LYRAGIQRRELPRPEPDQLSNRSPTALFRFAQTIATGASGATAVLLEGTPTRLAGDCINSLEFEKPQAISAVDDRLGDLFRD